MEAQNMSLYAGVGLKYSVTENLLYTKNILLFQNHIMRFMCNKHQIDKIPITDLIGMTGLQPITEIVKKTQIKLVRSY